MSVSEVAATTILGLPLVAWGGVFTFVLLAITAGYGMGLMKGWIKGNIGVHANFARVTIVIGLIHGVVALAWVMGL